MKEIITFKNVSMSFQTKYQRVDLFNNVNFQVNEGEFVVILGSSGSGKTTLLNLIAGFVKPTSGEIIAGGKNIASLNEKELCTYRNKLIGYVFQFFNLIYAFNAEENVSVPLILADVEKGERKEIVTSLLDRMNILERRKHYPMELSGGEQQRVAIARALANRPKIILADEPTGNLDEKTGDKILEILKEIHQEGKTVIVVTHDTKIAKLGDKVIDMKELLKDPIQS